MSTSKDQTLPAKLNLEIVAGELDLLKYSHDTQLEYILIYQRDRGLILKSNSPFDFNAQETSQGLEQKNSILMEI